MRDLDERDEDEFDTRPAVMSVPGYAPRTMTPRAPRTPSARRASFTALTSGTAAAATAAQGSFVASFAMPFDEQAAYLEHATGYLPQLVAECARSDSVSDDSTASGDAKWTRIKSSKKKSDVPVWEKDSDATNSSSRPKASVSSGCNNNTGDPEAANTSRDALQTYAVRSAVRVAAPLDVVLKTLDCSTVTTYRSFTKIIYESLVADTSVLFHSHSSVAPADVAGDASTPAVVTSPCAASESLAVRWLVCRCNNPMVSDCDLCLLEYSKVMSVDDVTPHYDGEPLFTIRARNNSRQSNNSDSDSDSAGVQHSVDSNRSHDGLHGRREFPSAYKIMTSIETKTCPELLDSHRLARCNVPLGGFLFYPTDNVDVTDVVFYMSIAQSSGSGKRFGSSSSSDRQFRAMQRALQHMARGIGRIKNAVDAYTISLRLEMLRNTRWVSNTERAECVVCYRRFHQLTRRRHHCRLCGDVICRDCSVYKDADLPAIGPTVLRICKLCDLNELKGSAGAAAAAASAAVVAAPVTTDSSNNAEQDVVSSMVPVLASPPSRKRSTTLNVDATKVAVQKAQQEPEIGRRFTTVVDGKDRRELPEQAFSCSKADIANRPYKWNTGGGGKPLVILSPKSAALYATRTGHDRVAAAADGTARGFAKAMTPTGTKLAIAPQDWRAAVHPSALASTASREQTSSTASHESNQFQAKSCSKVASAHDRLVFFDKIAARGGKGSVLRSPAGAMSMSHDSPRSDTRERDEKPLYGDDARAGRPQHEVRVVNAGKLVVPSHEHEMRKAAQSDKTNNNQQREARAELTIRKLQHIDAFEDILLTLCEQIATALDCKYAAVSLYARSPLPATLIAVGGSRSLPPSPSPSAPLEMIHFLKATGSKKLGKVAASLMCCTPVLELQAKVITRDALMRNTTFDFKRLPIVIGPQQVRFYAGVPIVDACGKMVGAFAVFDSSVYGGSSLSDVLPTMEALASVAMSAIEDRKTNLDLKSFLRNPLVDTTRDNQAARRSDPVFRIVVNGRVGNDNDSIGSDSDSDLDDVDFEYPAVSPVERQLSIHERISTRHVPSPLPAGGTRNAEYYKHQMEQLVQQARETEAQLHETSMAMKRQGVQIW